MRTIKLLLMAGGLLVSMHASSQVQLVRNPGDAKVIFRQDFEPADQSISGDSAWRAWCNTPVDTIREITYYSKIGTSSVSKVDIYDGSDDWKVFAVRTDSVIPMLNGVELYADDYSTIVNDDGDVERVMAFEKYGEDGGEYYFKYTTTANGGSSKNTAKYRRNLYVRGFDIEDESSYRLTLYVKAKKLAGNSPTFYADVMRGYHHQREAFSMGITSGTAFEYQKSGLSNNWEKITFMTYYLNDSVADGYTYYNSYSWADDWTWRPSDEQLQAWGKTLNPGDELNYVKQPDKYFVRLAFATDSVEYSIDNISLTKSWIGGVEHHGTMIRVDFGYETNLKQLAQEAYANTGIAAVQIPGDYFSVYGYLKNRAQWYNIEIATAEYHDDGYMYMWSKDVDAGGGRMVPNPFASYDSVYVNFNNPDVEGMTLRYTGQTYPKALDTVWVNEGKKVQNFTNELSSLNPYISKDKQGNPIRPVTQLPPVIVSVPFENGSFGLDSFDEITVKMSRLLKYDDEGETSAFAFLRVTKSGFKEIWKVSDATANSATFSRSASDIQNHGELTGDYTFEFINLIGDGTDYGSNVTLNYHFGDFSTTVKESELYCQSDWRSEIASGEVKGANPTSTYVHDADTEFKKGTGVKATSAKIRLYVLDYDLDDIDNCGYYLVTKSADEGPTGNIYTIINFNKAGGYSIKFKAAGWDKVGYPASIYFYPKPDGTLEDGDENGFKTLQAVSKTKLGDIDPQVRVSKSSVKDKNTGKWPDDVETFEYTFMVPAPGDYMFEWAITSGDDYGVFIGNYTISSMGSADLSTGYVKKLCDAVASAQEKLASADEDIYYGDAYDALEQAIEDGSAYKGHYPSKYDSVVAYVNQCIGIMKLRMDTVDLYYATEDKVEDKLDSFDGDTRDIASLAAYVALDDMFGDNMSLECPDLTNAQITEAIKAYKDAMDALDYRISIMDKFDEKCSQAATLIEAQNAHTEYAEYAGMVQGYNTATAYDQIAPTDSALLDAYYELYDAVNGYIFKVDGVTAYTRQAKELYNLAVTLGFEFDDAVKQQVASLQTQDAELETFLREAAILQILKIFASDDPDDAQKKEELESNFDVSALMPNYFLYNEAQTDRDMEKNSSGLWRIKRGTNTTAIPGWTLDYSSGNWYPIATRMNEGDALAWDLDGHAFAGGVRCGSSTKGSLSTVVAGLPQAYYWVGMNVHDNASGLTLGIKSGSVDIVSDKYAKSNGYRELGFDSILVVGDLTVTATQTSGSSGSEIDFRNFIVRLCGADPEYDYAGALTAQEAKVAGMMTFADAAMAMTDVKYFNLSGVMIADPKPGDIVIRKITLSNGAVVTDKVLIK
jgi:hypothetical protein